MAKTQTIIADIRVRTKVTVQGYKILMVGKPPLVIVEINRGVWDSGAAARRAIMEEVLEDLCGRLTPKPRESTMRQHANGHTARPVR